MNCQVEHRGSHKVLRQVIQGMSQVRVGSILNSHQESCYISTAFGVIQAHGILGLMLLCHWFHWVSDLLYDI